MGLKDEFLRHAGLMFIGIGLFNLFNFLYHFFMIRTLPPIDYGHLNTLTAFFMLITVPANTVQTTITKFVTSFWAQSQYAQAKSFLQHFLLVMAAVAFFLFISITLGSSFLSSFLQIHSRGLIILMGLILFLAMVGPVPSGGLQGLQRFGLLTFTLFVNGGLKLALGILFVLSGWGLLGAMGAMALAYLVTAFFSLFLLYFSLRMRGEKVYVRKDLKSDGSPDISEAYRYFFPVGLTLLCFMVLTNIDLILIKHFFTPIEAGYYSISQMVGKVILFLPIPIVMVMFPKVALLKMRDQGEKARSILWQSLIAGVLLCGGATTLCLLFPSLIIQFLSGKVYLECIPLVGIFSINMTFYALNLILLYYQLSIDQRRFLYPLMLCTLLQSGLIVLFHQSLIQVLWIVSLVALCLTFINVYLSYRPSVLPSPTSGEGAGQGWIK